MINPHRHLSVFAPHQFGERRIDLIGAGATGSRIALSLAKLGVSNLHVWDFDIVEDHNLANQVYMLEHVGLPKVEALKSLIEAAAATSIVPHSEKVDGSQELGEVVFLLTDTMSSRRQIWESGIRYKLDIALMIETRMGVDSGRVYTIDPRSPSQVRGWEAVLCEDAEAVTSACGSAISVGPTAEIVSGYAVWQFIRWFAKENGSEDAPENELIFSLRTPTLISNVFP